MLFYDDPAFVHEMLDYLEHFFLELLKHFVNEVEFDFASFGEDIAYKGRSFISPSTFKEFLQPHYVSICELLRGSGIEIIFVDSDGYVDELIPLWLEVGINGFSPLEVAAGEDALALRKEYGNNIVLAGNIDKRALLRGRAAIDHEVAKARALLAQGGYFPAVDHSVPPDVPLESFRYLLRALRSG
jgi:uroporphyrinogen decarboxylase